MLRRVSRVSIHHAYSECSSDAVVHSNVLEGLATDRISRLSRIKVRLLRPRTLCSSIREPLLDC